MVRLCHRLLKFTQKSGFEQFVSTLNEDLKKDQSDLDFWANSIKEEVNLLVAQRVENEAHENSRFRALSRKTTEAVLHRNKIEAKLKILDLCSTYDYETTWKQTRKIGNTVLFKEDEKYRDWKIKSVSSTLIYTGKLGSGKSVLLANIVDDVNLHVQEKNTTVAYFFCRSDIAESLKARTIIGSLARQLLYPIQDLTNAARVFHSASPVPSSEAIVDLLKYVVSTEYKAYFILDGLDELDDMERNILIPQLRTLQDTLNLILCVSCRLEPKLKLDPRHLIASKITAIPEGNPDIEAFISAELKSGIESQKLIIGDPMLILDIHDKLLEGSQGMFLWVALQINSLYGMKTDHNIRRALENLPRTLSETFLRILERSEMISSGTSYQIAILELIAITLRPLTVEELREALSVVPSNPVWDSTKLLNDIYSALGCCGSLITIDEEEMTVRFVHHSVKQFLVTEFKGRTDNTAFTIDNAMARMADIIITYLNYGVFDTQLSKTVVPKIIAKSAPSKIIRSTFDSSNISRLALKLLDARSQPHFDIRNTLGEVAQFSSSSSIRYHFYTYASLYWPHYITHFSKQMTDISRLLEGIFKRHIKTDVINKSGQIIPQNQIEIRYTAMAKLLADISESDLNGKNIIRVAFFWWLKRYGNDNLVQPLRDDSAYYANHGFTAEEILFIEARKDGYDNVVKFLYALSEFDSKFVDPEASEETCSLVWAILGNDEDTVKILLGSDKVDPNIQNHIGDTPLHSAVSNQNWNIVNLLLGSDKVNPNIMNVYGYAPLHSAVSNDRENMATLLLGSDRVDPNTKSVDGSAPLHLAIMNENEYMVRLLLSSRKTDPKIKTAGGETPLQLATSKQNRNIIELLPAFDEIRSRGIELVPSSDEIQRRRRNTTVRFHGPSPGSRTIAKPSIKGGR